MEKNLLKDKISLPSMQIIHWKKKKYKHVVRILPHQTQNFWRIEESPIHFFFQTIRVLALSRDIV